MRWKMERKDLRKVMITLAISVGVLMVTSRDGWNSFDRILLVLIIVYAVKAVMVYRRKE
ncbi:MAG TPA: hypothetical protein VNQ78_09855 [Paracoccus sp. (in: a-proteobacteria)]|uniref:hypothetical protein n=1 Tax=Paracoccus sp. TaxID=267 RepID=UPI002C7772D3|nr:hypothetical protein [Paracoccus sp. (in: a-proteobacteria)]HWL56962.1 hypothetical protein [Paracoccus sp. (in: a-proteobacteria)]